MKHGIAVGVAVLLALALSVVPVAAQQPPLGKPPMASEEHGTPGGGMQRMAGGPQGMMCPMMSMMGRQGDPRMMQMHGEMMKAMGDIMIKYGKMQEGSGTR